MTMEKQRAELSMSIEDELFDWTGDFLSLTHFEPVLKQLFIHPSGDWLKVKSLFADNSEITERLDELETKAGDPLCVVWLDDPAAEPDDDYSVIVFFVAALHWHTLAVYNRGRLQRSSAA